jgi:hypothetical protein
MVAIHIPRTAHDDWAFDEPATGGSVPVLRRVPSPAPERLRRLPDRATRVRRRRLAVLMAAVALAGAVGLGVRALSGLTEVGGTSTPQPIDVGTGPVAGQQYVVQPGDTLWSIAATIAPDADPRPVVDALRAANGGPDLEVGTRLTLDVD